MTTESRDSGPTTIECPVCHGDGSGPGGADTCGRCAGEGSIPEPPATLIDLAMFMGWTDGLDDAGRDVWLMRAEEAASEHVSGIMFDSLHAPERDCLACIAAIDSNGFQDEMRARPP